MLSPFLAILNKLSILLIFRSVIWLKALFYKAFFFIDIDRVINLKSVQINTNKPNPFMIDLF